MQNQQPNIDGLINSVGAETLIKYFYEFQSLNSEELISLIERNNEQWEESSVSTKISAGKRLFRDNRALEAIEHIILRKKENKIPNGSWVKMRAKEIYNEYNFTSEIPTEDEKVTKDEKRILVKYRLKQGKFRRELISHWEGCSITGCKNNDVLIASHITPFSESEEEEKYDVNNGLLLTPTYDKLFDLHLISFDKDGIIIISKRVDSEDLISLGITGNETLRMEKVTPKTQDYYLMQHRQEFEKKEKNNQETGELLLV